LVTLCLRTAATSGFTVYPSDVVWEWRATVEWYWQGKTKEIGRKNLSHCHFFHHKSTLTNPGLRSKTPATNCMSHDAAYCN
jgi:hypothetical protein